MHNSIPRKLSRSDYESSAGQVAVHQRDMCLPLGVSRASSYMSRKTHFFGLMAYYVYRKCQFVGHITDCIEQNFLFISTIGDNNELYAE